NVELLRRGYGEGGAIAILEDRYGRERQLVVDTRVIGDERGGKEAVADDFVGASLKRDKYAREAGQGGAQDTGTHGILHSWTGRECFTAATRPPCITP